MIAAAQAAFDLDIPDDFTCTCGHWQLTQDERMQKNVKGLCRSSITVLHPLKSSLLSHLYIEGIFLFVLTGLNPTSREALSNTDLKGWFLFQEFDPLKLNG